MEAADKDQIHPQEYQHNTLIKGQTNPTRIQASDTLILDPPGAFGISAHKS
jgi:hypothetical protein